MAGRRTNDSKALLSFFIVMIALLFKLIKWIFIILYRVIRWLIHQTGIGLEKLSIWVQTKLVASGREYEFKNVRAAVTTGAVVTFLGIIGLTTLFNQQAPLAEPILPTMTNTVLPSPTFTFTAQPSSTPTNTPIPPTPTPLFGTNANSSCIPKDREIEIAQVIRVIDGDTIVVKMDDQEYHLRYIGIDSPENGDTYQSESTALNVALVLGKTAYLVKDQNDTDSFDRLLRYVFVGDTFVNYEMIKQGAAWAGSWPPDTACDQTFNEAQIAARNSLAGLWGIPPTAAVVVAPAPDTSKSGIVNIDEPVATEPPSGACDPAYPTVCIPPPPPDLDCKDVPYKRFQVLSPDPHNFDGDGNGIGCESG